MKYHIDSVDASQGPTYEKAKKFGQMLLDNCTCKSSMYSVRADNQVLRQSINHLFIGMLPSPPPLLLRLPPREISFTPRFQEPMLGSLNPMSRVCHVHFQDVRERTDEQRWHLAERQNTVSTQIKSNLILVGPLIKQKHEILMIDKLWELVNSQPSITPAQKSAIKSMYGEVIKSLGQSASPEATTVELPGITRAKGTKQRRSSSQFLRPNVEDKTEVEEAHMPFLHLKRKTGTSWAYSHKLTNICTSTLVEVVMWC